VEHLPGRDARFALPADLDGDGDLDQAAVDGGWIGGLSVLRNRWRGELELLGAFPVEYEPQEAAAADLEGDGDLDLHVCSMTLNDVSVLANRSLECPSELPPFQLRISAPPAACLLPGDQVLATCGLKVNVAGPESGAEGWRIAVKVSGPCEPLTPSLLGTVLEGREPEFLDVRLIDPALNGGSRGVVSAVVLGTNGVPAVLGRGEHDVLKLPIEVAGPGECRLMYDADLIASPGAAPAANVVRQSGQDVPPSLSGAVVALSSCNTPAGELVPVSLRTDAGAKVTVTFQRVTVSGNTAVAHAPCPPAGSPDFELCAPSACFELSTTAELVGSLSVCVDYGALLPACAPSGQGGQILLVSDNDGDPATRLDDITDPASSDAASHVVCGTSWRLPLVYGLAGRPAPALFRRGDADQSGAIEITDAIRILGYLFLGGIPPACLDAADSDDNGALQISDPVMILGSLFLGGFGPSPPFPGCGPDPRVDGLGCAVSAGC